LLGHGRLLYAPTLLGRRVFRPGNWQERLEITREVIEAVRGDFSAVLGLGDNERALEDSL
jgi:hypothetical protein